jgi:hypothetical protein
MGGMSPADFAQNPRSTLEPREGIEPLLREDPFLARVVDFVTGNSERSIVHLEVLGVPDQVIDELRHANLLPA